MLTIWEVLISLRPPHYALQSFGPLLYTPDFLRGITPHNLGVVPSLRATGKGPPTLLKTAALFRIRPTVRCAPRHGAHTTLVSNWFAIICTATMQTVEQQVFRNLSSYSSYIDSHSCGNGLRLPASNLKAHNHRKSCRRHLRVFLLFEHSELNGK